MKSGPRVIAGGHDSPAGRQALRVAAAQARARGCPLVVVHAYRWPGWDRWGLAEDTARRTLAQVVAAALGGRPPGVELREIAVPDRSPGRALCSLVLYRDDLVVVGASRRRPRTDRYCLRHAPCPVLVVPDPATAVIEPVVQPRPVVAAAARASRTGV